MSGEIAIFDFVLLGVIGLLEVAFGWYLLKRYERTASIIMFAVFTFSTAGWVLTNAFGMILTRGSDEIDITFRLSYVFASFIFPALFFFVHYFPFKQRYDWMIILLVFIPSIIISSLSLFGDGIVTGFSEDQKVLVYFGDQFWIYTAFLISMFALVIIEIVRKIQSSDGGHREHMKLLLFAVLLSGIIGLLANLILPLIDIRIPNWVGPGSSMFYLALVWWATQRK